MLDAGGEADIDMADRDSDSGSDGGEDQSESDDQSDGEGDELLEKRGMGSRQDDRERDDERERGQRDGESIQGGLCRSVSCAHAGVDGV